ncbi:MAG TPA: hypothetical protein VGI11_19100 [Variovorax sp.]
MDTEAIALVVDEPIAGHFYWVLQKQDGADCRPVEAAEGPMPSYGAAMMAGIAALQRRADARKAAAGPARVPVVQAFVTRPETRGPSHLH